MVKRSEAHGLASFFDVLWISMQKLLAHGPELTTHKWEQIAATPVNATVSRYDIVT